MKKALVIIDVQKGFINKYTKNLPRKIRNFIAKKGKSYDIVLFTQYKNHPKSNFVKNLGYRGFMNKKSYDIVEDLKGMVTKKNLFAKDTYGSFVAKHLPNVLKKNKIGEIHLAGIDTEHCVLTFARDAFDRGYKVVVLKNLCGSHSDSSLHDAALAIINGNIGKVR